MHSFHESHWAHEGCMLRKIVTLESARISDLLREWPCFRWSAEGMSPVLALRRGKCVRCNSTRG